MPDERPDEEAEPGLRKGRTWAFFGLLLVVTSGWLPWWGASYKESTGYAYDFGAKLFGLGNAAEGTSMVWVWITSILVTVAVGWIFVRIAGKSWLYEPQEWQRDLLIISGVLLAALISTAFWPTDLPFWGGRTYANVTGGATGEATFRPALGWWTALLGMGCLIAAYTFGRSRDSP